MYAGHSMKKFILPFLMILCGVCSAQAAEKFYSDEDMREFMCEPDDSYSYYNYGTIKNIVKPHLSISGWSGDNANAAAALKLEVSRNKGSELLKVFEDKVQSATGFLGIKYSPDITEDYDTRYSSCLKSLRKEGYDRFKKCRAKIASEIGSIYGERLGKVYCNVRLKGKEFPVMAHARCSIRFGPDFSYNRSQELEFLNYFSPEVGPQAMEKLLEKYAENISEIVTLGKRCL